MHIVVQGDDAAMFELTACFPADLAKISKVSRAEDFLNYPDADACFDLQFENTGTRISTLQQLAGKPVFINWVSSPLSMPDHFIRLNAWPGFLNRSVWEAVCKNETTQKKAEALASRLNKKICWVPDNPGMITPRIISMIINEAYLALEEGVSTRQEIDIAMKTGTNYPYGPFEWAAKIGLQEVYQLLTELSKTNIKYKPSGKLTTEANLK